MMLRLISIITICMALCSCSTQKQHVSKTSATADTTIVSRLQIIDTATHMLISTADLQADSLTITIAPTATEPAKRATIYRPRLRRSTSDSTATSAVTMRTDTMAAHNSVSKSTNTTHTAHAIYEPPDIMLILVFVISIVIVLRFYLHKRD